MTKQQQLSRILTAAAALLITVSPASAITIGPGPVLQNSLGDTTDKKGTTWYEEYQDWSRDDVRSLDSNNDNYKFNNAEDGARDIIALYSRDDGTNIYFRMDLFELGFNEQDYAVDAYIAIDCATGGQVWFPDFCDSRTDHPWEVCIGVYNSSAASVYDQGWTNHSGTEFIGYGGGGYWRGDLDSVEFGVKRSFLIEQGWDGSSAFNIQAFTTRDGTDGGNGEIDSQASDLVDAIGTIVRGSSSSNGWCNGGVSSDATTGRAKYAVIAHANQSLATKSGTQNHIYTDDSAGDGHHPGFIRLLDSAEMLNVPVNLHISGTLLMSFMWATQDPTETGLAGYPSRDGPTFLNRVSNFVTNGPGSIIGGVLAEHIMPYYEGLVNEKSIEQNSKLIEHMFGLTEQDMKVMHVPERVIRSNTNNVHTSSTKPLDGKTFEEIEDSGFIATYLDEVTHLHWWFYPNEQSNAGWDDNNCGRWAGGQGNDEEIYHHKVHKINGVYSFIINDREDQSKFGNDGGGMLNDTRYTLLQKALDADSSQLTLVFDDWEAFAGNSFASGTPNNNASQFHNTLRWAANHQWIEIVNLKDVITWATNDSSWVIDHGYVFDKASQTYEWLKRASEHSYDNWYYGGGLEEDFFNRVPVVHWDGGAWSPAGMKKYGDMNTTNTLMRDSWDVIQSITSTNLKELAEWSFSAMIYETAWHDEDANPDQYKSRNYQDISQGGFTRGVADGNCDESYEDGSYDNTSSWATRLHGHVRDMGVMKDASDWVESIKSGGQGASVSVYSKDIDDDTLYEYVLCNNKVYLCFERWGARLIKAFIYDSSLNGGDAREVVGVPVCNPAEEHENEGADNNRCSGFKDRYSTGLNDNRFVDMDYASTAPVQGSNSWTFISKDGNVTKKISLWPGRDVALAEYGLNPAVGTLYSRFGLGPNQMDMMLNGPENLTELSDSSFRGLNNASGGGAYVIAGKNCSFVNGSISSAGWENRELPLVEQYEIYNTATNFSVALAFSQASAADLDDDGLSNTNEAAIGTNHEKADSDGDGIDDGYEVANNLNATSNDAQGDKDGDGALNIHEYVANTRADNSNSLFAIRDIRFSSTNIEVEFTTAPDRHYRILYADDDPPFTWNIFNNTNLGVGTWNETGGSETVRVLSDDFTPATSGGEPGGTRRIYRIGVERP
ncbi:MAG: hypothetical protein KJ626_09045 [Verrucomicrobia bacterium]|nr:hypothetical protein [Verrucomicrobiota bacterium]